MELFDQAHIVLTNEEKSRIEIADFGLGDYGTTGLGLITYVNNALYCAKDLVLLPNQTCPEHKHPPIGDLPGKTETFRCRWGKVWLYVEGEPTEPIRARIPDKGRAYYTFFHEIELTPGKQYTIPPNTLHWFQAADDGAIISEFSTTSRDELDIFTNPNVVRVPFGNH